MQSSIIRRSKPMRLTLFAFALAVLTPFAYADSAYATAWGPSVGSVAPMLSAADQDGRQQDIKSLSGSNGLLFVFNRSVDW